MTGIWLAANAPERVTSLAVCCAALTPMPDAQAWHDRAALVREPRAWRRSPAWSSRAGSPRGSWPASRSRSRPSPPCSRARTPRATPAAARPSPRSTCARSSRSVKAPTLVVSGAEDVAAPPSVGAYTARNIPGARLTVIQAASHFAHYEKPGPVTDALLTHFQATLRLTTGAARRLTAPSGGRAHRLSRADGDIADDRRGRGRPGRAARRARAGWPPTVRAIHASPAAVGCRPVACPGERPPAGQRVHDDGPRVRRRARRHDRPSVWRSAGEPPGATAKVVSSAIRAAGAAARIRSTAARDPPSFKPGRHADVVVPRLHDHQRRAERRAAPPGSACAPSARARWRWP